MKNQPHSPFQSLSNRQIEGLTMLTAILLVGIMIIMGIIEMQLGDQGIVAFELAGDYERSQQIMEGWGQLGQMKAAFLLGLDYLFIPIYCILIALLSFRVSVHFSRLSLQSFGHTFSWVTFIAGGLDVIENFALYQLLAGTTSFFWSKIAFWCAIPKFGIVIIGILYILIGGFRYWTKN